MKVQITLDTCDALDREAFLALAKLLRGTTGPQVTEDRSNALETRQAILRGEEPSPIEEEPSEESKTIPPVVEEQSEEPKVISVDKWAGILDAKRKELGLVGKDGNSVGAPLASAKSEFIDFVKEQSKKYGADSPKFLTPEKLYQFVDEVFSKIVYDPVLGFTTTTIPNEPSF